MSELSPWASRRGVLAGASALLLAGCRGEPEKKAPAKQAPAGPPEGSLEWAVAGAWRSPADRARDTWRHPKETLAFYGLAPGMTVIEFWPGAGWWTEILAPYLTRNQGTLYAANFQVGQGADPAQVEIVERFRQRFGADKKLYGEVKMSEFGPTSGPPTPPSSADLVIFSRNLHNWMAAGIAEKAFADAFTTLKPGGILGVEQHRAEIGGTQDPAATNGYVQEPYVKQLAAEAGFAFVGASEVNANPKDTKDHPFGVWTLPPQRLTAPRGQPANPAFDRSKYDAIGESDRMTLKFRKPA